MPLLCCCHLALAVHAVRAAAAGRASALERGEDALARGEGAAAAACFAEACAGKDAAAHAAAAAACARHGVWLLAQKHAEKAAKALRKATKVPPVGHGARAGAEALSAASVGALCAQAAENLRDRAALGKLAAKAGGATAAQARRALEAMDREWSADPCAANFRANVAVLAQRDKDVMNREHDLDTGLFQTSGESGYTNVNSLQEYAFRGSARGVESVVRMGAALNYPVPDTLNFDCARPRDEPRRLALKAKFSMALPGTTPLMLAVSQCAVWHVCGGRDDHTAHLAPQFVECIKILLGLGSAVDANVHKKPAKWPRAVRDQFLDWHGGLAPLGVAVRHGMLEVCDLLLAHGAELDSDTLAEARTGSIDDGAAANRACHKWTKAELDRLLAAAALHRGKARPEPWCRCGSRLAYAKCHGFGQRLQPQGKPSPHVWRYAPGAACVCRSKKTYYDCCWKTTDYFADDCTGGLSHSVTMSRQQVGDAGMQSMQTLVENAEPDQPVFGNMTADKLSEMNVQMLRSVAAMPREQVSKLRRQGGQFGGAPIV